MCELVWLQKLFFLILTLSGMERKWQLIHRRARDLLQLISVWSRRVFSKAKDLAVRLALFVPRNHKATGGSLRERFRPLAFHFCISSLFPN